MSADRFNKTQKILSTKAVGTANILEIENAGADLFLKEGLPLIRCECGAEILVVPDLRAMNRVINNHVTEHRKREKNVLQTLAPSIRINQLLTQLTLLKASEENRA
jgi:hypothetical protein